MEINMAGNAGMENIIAFVNRFQDVVTRAGVTMDLDLPQIAVVGGQSAGKSSVLENFVGRDFLPRGSGIVTRRPLILQLINNGYRKEEYAEFLHCPNKKFTNFDDVRKEIENETNRVASGKEISHIPINLRIYSPKVLDLTLVDLPGLTKVAIGNQPVDIESRIRKMILEFISKESCLILAVTPANTDLADSDALKLAKEVDPKGTRTIGVITKLDLMDEGTHARDILENRLLPLRRGYVGVVNRSQKAIDENKEITAAIDAEETFFKCHDEYKHIADKCGTPYLQKILNQQLKNHIQVTLHVLRFKLIVQKNALKKNLNIEDMKLDESSVKTKTLILMINKLQAVFSNAIGFYESDEIGEKINGGTKISYLIHERFPKEIEKIKSSRDDLFLQIKLAILNIRGVKSGMFMPNKVFAAVAIQQTILFQEPAINCISQVVAELHDLLKNRTEMIDKYPRLREIIDEKLLLFIKECEQNCEAKLVALLDYELFYINAKFVDFIGLKKMKSQLPDHDETGVDKEEKNSEESDEDYNYEDTLNVSIKDLENDEIVDHEANILAGLVESYMKIVTKTIQDRVPKTVMSLIIKKIKNFINVDLLSQLLIEENIMSLMDLREDEKNERENLIRMYNVTEEAVDILKEIY